MNHRYPEIGSGHECSYVDCWCDHRTCEDCGVEEYSDEGLNPCPGPPRRAAAWKVWVLCVVLLILILAPVCVATWMAYSPDRSWFPLGRPWERR